MQNLLNFFKNLFKENLYLKLTVIVIIILALSVYLFSLTFPKKEEQISGQPQSQVASVSAPGSAPRDICNASIEQPKCYEGDFPTPTFKWEYCDSNSVKNQKIFRVQVDDRAYQNSAFPSPEFDSGNVLSSDTKYTVDSPVLKFDTPYYWGVTITDKSDVKTGWWGWGDKNFATSPSCQ